MKAMMQQCAKTEHSGARCVLESGRSIVLVRKATNFYFLWSVVDSRKNNCGRMGGNAINKLESTFFEWRNCQTSVTIMQMSHGEKIRWTFQWNTKTESRSAKPAVNSVQTEEKNGAARDFMYLFRLWLSDAEFLRKLGFYFTRLFYDKLDAFFRGVLLVQGDSVGINYVSAELFW